VTPPERVHPEEAGPRFGLGFQSDKSIADYERLAAAAEGFGFDVLSVFGDLWFQPPIVALLAMARVTSRVALGPACMSPFVLHPVEIAAQIAALDAASDGRAYLGLARGGWLAELGVGQRGAGAAVIEAAQVAGALLAGETTGVQGRRFSLPRGARLRDNLVRRSVPLLIGTWGPRLAAAAGTLASEVKLGGSANPAMVSLVRGWVDEGASGAGRAPGDVGVVVGAVTVVDEDALAARRRARREVAMYLEVVGALDPTVELPQGLLAGLRDRLSAGDVEAAAALIPDELLERFAFAGTPEQVAAHATAVIAAGAARVEFGTPHGLSDDSGVALLGSRVLPLLREQLPLRPPAPGPPQAS
jgi:5,10-methylenetetrahydromethanopterin reductase